MAFILKDARRMESIVNDLLLLTGTDAAEAPPGGAVGLREVAEEIVADARILAGERVVDLRPGGEVLVRAERDAVRRILTELLVNAVKYTGHGGRIEVTVAPRGDRGRMVVSDNGVGDSSGRFAARLRTVLPGGQSPVPPGWRDRWRNRIGPVNRAIPCGSLPRAGQRDKHPGGGQQICCGVPAVCGG